jgi:hypothetical protein
MAVGKVQGDAHGSGMRFTLRGVDGTAKVRVVYRGSVPDLFRVGRHVYMRGELRGDLFVAIPDSLVTEVPIEVRSEGWRLDSASRSGPAESSPWSRRPGAPSWAAT